MTKTDGVLPLFHTVLKIHKEEYIYTVVIEVTDYDDL